MTIKEFKSDACRALNSLYEPAEQRFVINALFRDLARIPSYWYHTEENHSFDSLTEQALRRALERLASGEPLQYVLGYVTFGGCRIEVDPRVLIPRPETEELLGHLSETVPGEGRLLDACTGSGALAVAWKAVHNRAAVFACDLSAEALDVARANAKRNALDVTFFATDVLCVPQFAADATAAGIHPESLDCLVSNPPYVTQKEKALMHPRVWAHEPAMALFVADNDPLCFYRALAEAGLSLLKKGGCLWVELNEAYGSQNQELVLSKGYSGATVYRDFFGKERFLCARK